jgi:hypothetical protein
MTDVPTDPLPLIGPDDSGDTWYMYLLYPIS